jgi:hypothetical protein
MVKTPAPTHRRSSIGTSDYRQAAFNSTQRRAAARLVFPTLVVSDPKLKAKLDRQYRDNDKYRKTDPVISVQRIRRVRRLHRPHRRPLAPAAPNVRELAGKPDIGERQ